MAMRVDKKSRRSVHSASDATVEISAYARLIRSIFKGFPQCGSRELKLLGKLQVEGPAQAILVFKQEIMHLPEFSLSARKKQPR
jgi:hypothetical protein